MHAQTIAARIVDAILARRLAPGERLREQALSDLFRCSRTGVREALMQLSARGVVTVSARRGWFVASPSPEQAHEALVARRIIETGLIRCAPRLGAPQVQRLEAHIVAEQQAIAEGDVGQRSYLLGDFHVCLAECLGNKLLAETLRDFTARTTLSAMLHQSTPAAHQSCQEHVDMLAALRAGDHARAEALMSQHLQHVEHAIHTQGQEGPDPLSALRVALSPMPARATEVSSTSTGA